MASTTAKYRTIKTPKVKKSIDEKFADLLKKIKGKKVLILDLETTGLIADKKRNTEYENNELYSTCRVIEFGYYYSTNFGNDKETVIHDYFRKPMEFETNEFEISEEAANVHGITTENIMKNGYTFVDILKHNLYTYLCMADYIICHNVNFDMYVLLNELHRISKDAPIHKLLTMHKYYKFYCTCIMSGFKKLTTLYKDKFNCEPENAHRAYGDVKLLLELILGEQIDNANIKIETTII